MPFKNRKQQKACYALKAKGKNGSWNCDEWSHAQTGGDFRALSPIELARMRQNRADATSVAGISNAPTVLKQREQAVTAAQIKAQKEADINELARRKTAIANSNNNSFSFKSSAVKDKMRLFPDDPHSTIDEYFNPLTMIGGMADNLGHSRSVKEFGINTLMPLATGAMGFSPIDDAANLYKSKAVQSLGRIPSDIAYTINQNPLLQLAKVQKNAPSIMESDFAMLKNINKAGNIFKNADIPLDQQVNKLVKLGLPEEQIKKLTGKSSQELLQDAQEYTANKKAQPQSATEDLFDSVPEEVNNVIPPRPTNVNEPYTDRYGLNYSSYRGYVNGLRFNAHPTNSGFTNLHPIEQGILRREGYQPLSGEGMRPPQRIRDLSEIGQMNNLRDLSDIDQVGNNLPDWRQQAIETDSDFLNRMNRESDEHEMRAEAASQSRSEMDFLGSNDPANALNEPLTVGDRAFLNTLDVNDVNLARQVHNLRNRTDLGSYDQALVQRFDDRASHRLAQHLNESDETYLQRLDRMETADNELATRWRDIESRGERSQMEAEADRYDDGLNYNSIDPSIFRHITNSPRPPKVINSLDKAITYMASRSKGNKYIPKFEGDASNVETMLPSLSRSSSRDAEQIIKEKSTEFSNSPSGQYFRGAGSLSDGSFPAYLLNLKRKVTEGTALPEIEGFNTMNSLGFLHQADIPKEKIAGYLNKHIEDFNKSTGKIIPKTYVKDGQIYYPEIVIKKKQNGGKYQFGGNAEEDQQDNDFFSTLFQAAQQQQQYQPQEESIDYNVDEPVQEDAPDYSDLQSQLEDLKAQVADQNRLFNESNDQFVNMLFSDDNSNNEPILFGDDEPTDDTFNYDTDLRSSIAKRESGGNYNAFTPAGGGAGAVGKYQFRWNLHKDDIASVTGITNREDFKNNPQAQEQYFTHWENTTLKPVAQEIQKYAPNVPLKNIEKQVHFAGPQGAKDYFLKGKVTRDAFGTTNNTYQTGGIASSEEALRTGLNNTDYDHMILDLPNRHNTIRGLDSGEPVLVMDSKGTQRILKGNKDTTRLKGKVYEIKL